MAYLLTHICITQPQCVNATTTGIMTLQQSTRSKNFHNIHVASKISKILTLVRKLGLPWRTVNTYMDNIVWHWLYKSDRNIVKAMRKTTRLKSGWGFGQTNSPLSTARVLIDAVGLCLLRVSEVWRLFAPDLWKWINSFSGSDFKPRPVYKTWYFCYLVTNFNQQF